MMAIWWIPRIKLRGLLTARLRCGPRTGSRISLFHAISIPILRTVTVQRVSGMEKTHSFTIISETPHRKPRAPLHISQRSGYGISLADKSLPTCSGESS